MAILPIRLLPEPILRRKSRHIDEIEPAIQKLAADMIETMQAGSGAGLAAPQVGILRRLITIQTPDVEPFALINPEITASNGERRVREGCLSVPGYIGQVKRAESITAKGHNQNGKEIRIKAEGLLAQALEHEIDHLNGILYMDHLKEHQELIKDEPDVEYAAAEVVAV